MVAWHVFVRPDAARARHEMEGLTAVAYVVGDLGAAARCWRSRSLRARRAAGAAGRAARASAWRCGSRANALYWYDVLLGPARPRRARRVGDLQRGLAGFRARRDGAGARLGAAGRRRRRRRCRARRACRCCRRSRPRVGYVGAGAGRRSSRLSLDMGILVIVGVGAHRGRARAPAGRAARRRAARGRAGGARERGPLPLARAERLRHRARDRRGRRGPLPHALGRPLRPGRRARRLDGSPLHELVHPEDRVARARADPRTRSPAPARRPRRSGACAGRTASWHYVEARAKSVPEDPNLGGVILTLRSVHERKVLEERLAHQAFHDPLTHLANRVLLSERLEHALVRARRGGQPVSGAVHRPRRLQERQRQLRPRRRRPAAGRAVAPAARLRARERHRGAARAATSSRCWSRSGGGLDAARQVADARRRRAARGRSRSAGARSCSGRASASPRARAASRAPATCCATPTSRCTARSTPARARWSCSRPACRPRCASGSSSRPSCAARSSAASCALVYQPIVALGVGPDRRARRRCCAGTTRARGRLRPADFFAAAEAAGRDGRRSAAGPSRTPAAARCAWPVIDEAGQLPLAVRQRRAAACSATREFVDRVEQAVAGGAAARRPPRARADRGRGRRGRARRRSRRCARLRALGVRVAIDDFGTGYSSLSYLRDMPVDILKLDKLFVDGARRATATRSCWRAASSTSARALGKLVVAEGIEQEEQAARLRELGCTLGQGFLLLAAAGSARRCWRRLQADAADAKPDPGARAAAVCARVSGVSLGTRSTSSRPRWRACSTSRPSRCARLAALAARARGITFVFVAARGTSDNAGLYAKYLWGACNGLPVALAAPSLFTIYGGRPTLRRRARRGDLAVRPVARHRRRARGGAAAGRADAGDRQRRPTRRWRGRRTSVIDICAGPEQAVAATKTYTAQLMAIAMLSAALGRRRGALGRARRACPASVRAGARARRRDRRRAPSATAS